MYRNENSAAAMAESNAGESVSASPAAGENDWWRCLQSTRHDGGVPAMTARREEASGEKKRSIRSYRR